ncbi:MAG: hypothetical protein WCR44_05845 [Verrucomicrobiota bacterium]|jgi:hypothetical protein
MKDSLVQAFKESSVVQDSELIAGFFSPVGFAGLILILVMINHVLFSELVFSIHGRFMDPLLKKGRAFHARVIGYLCILIMVVGHLMEIVIWASSLVMTGLIPSMNTALYYCGSTYTTLGFGSDPFQHGRSAITVVIALSGMLTVAVTTAILMLQFGRSQEIRKNIRHNSPLQ